MLSLLASIFLCVLALWLFFGLLTALCYRSVRSTLHVIDPAQASRLLLAWLAIPALAAALATCVLYLPDIAQWFIAGHCHGNVCRIHGPQSTLAIFPATALSLWTLSRLVHCLLTQWLPTRRLCGQLTLIGDDSGEFVTLGSNQPTAFTLGWLSPTIFISEGMKQSCSQQDISCILHHEAAHRQRRDNLRLLIGCMLTAPLPERWQRNTLDDLKLCCEKACDQHAAKALSRKSVAAALIRVARVQQQSIPISSLAFVGNRTEERILTLLDEPQAPLANHRVLVIASAALLVVLAIVNPLHRAVEWIP